MHDNLGTGLIDTLSWRKQDKTSGDFQATGQSDMSAAICKTEDTRLEMQRALTIHLNRLS